MDNMVRASRWDFLSPRLSAAEKRRRLYLHSFVMIYYLDLSCAYGLLEFRLGILLLFEV